MLFLLITTMGSYLPQLLSACVYAFHTLTASWFLHSILYGNFSRDSLPIIMSSPCEPIGLDSMSSSWRLRVSTINLANHCCNFLPLAFADEVFIKLYTHSTSTRRFFLWIYNFKIFIKTVFYPI